MDPGPAMRSAAMNALTSWNVFRNTAKNRIPDDGCIVRDLSVGCIRLFWGAGIVPGSRSALPSPLYVWNGPKSDMPLQKSFVFLGFPWLTIYRMRYKIRPAFRGHCSCRSATYTYESSGDLRGSYSISILIETSSCNLINEQ